MTTTMSSPPTEKDSSPSAAPSFTPPMKRSGVNWLAALAVVIVVALISGAVWWGVRTARAGKQVELVDKFTVEPRSFLVTLKEKGELKAAESNQLKCEVEGRSTIIFLVEEGKQVEEGELLVELASDQIEDRIRQEELKETTAVMAYESAQTALEIQRDKNESDIRKAELEIELKRLELKKYEEGDWQQQLRDSEIMIEQAQTTLERRKEDFEASKKLYAKEYITEAEYKEDEFNYKKAQWDLEKAQRGRQVLLDYTRITDKRQRESDLEEAIKECERIKKNAAAEEKTKAGSLEAKEKELELVREQLDKFRKQKEKCKITAPTPGFVVYGDTDTHRFYRGGEAQINEGATVYERQVLVTLPDTSTMVVAARIHESKLAKIRMEQSVTVEVEGIPDEQFTGTVTKIAPLANTQNRWINPDVKEYETEITLDQADEALKPGATAHAEILVTTSEDTLAVPVQAVYSKAGHQFLFRWTNGKVEPIEIELGETNEEWAGIAQGISEGDQVLLAFEEKHKRLLPDLPPKRPHNGAIKSPGGGAGLPGAARATAGKTRRGPAVTMKMPGIEELKKIPGLENLTSLEDLKNIKDPKILKAVEEALTKQIGGRRPKPGRKPGVDAKPKPDSQRQATDETAATAQAPEAGGHGAAAPDASTAKHEGETGGAETDSD
jgi:HlyD family secretion protein